MSIHTCSFLVQTKRHLFLSVQILFVQEHDSEQFDAHKKCTMEVYTTGCVAIGVLIVILIRL